jgi:hypothetical protein
MQVDLEIVASKRFHQHEGAITGECARDVHARADGIAHAIRAPIALSGPVFAASSWLVAGQIAARPA